MTDTPQELLPCWCSESAPEWVRDNDYLWIECFGCGLMTPANKSAAEALKCWNARAPSVSPQVDDERMKEILETWGDSDEIRYSPAFDVVKRDIDYLLSLLADHPDDARVERLRPAPAND